MQLSNYNKALVPLGVAVIAAILANFGILETMTVKDILTLIVTSVMVYLVPNTKA